MPEPIAYVWFVDGVKRPIFAEPDGKQYVLDDDGEPIYGVWYIARTRCSATGRSLWTTSRSDLPRGDAHDGSRVVDLHQVTSLGDGRP